VTLSGTPERLDRSLRKRQMILSAGRQLFLSNGYQGTSMDQVAATAAVSKQTVYKHFGEKRALLYAIVID
jgi:TetR/AcrR family transcriptional repressor of mexJK operon